MSEDYAVKSERLLAFDFSSPFGTLCLWRDSCVCASWTSGDISFSSRSEILPRVLSDTLDDCVISFSTLSGLCVVRGPGSYTGLRSSLAAAKGLLLAQPSIRVYSLTSFEASFFALRAQISSPSLVLTLVESFRSDWYAQAFCAGEPETEPLSKPLSRAYALDDAGLRALVLRLLARRRADEAVLLCGVTARRAREGILSSFAERDLRLVDCDATAEAFSRPLTLGMSLSRGDFPRYARGSRALTPMYIGDGV